VRVLPAIAEQLNIPEFRRPIGELETLNKAFPPPHPMALQPTVAKDLLIIESSRSHSDTPHSAGLLWTSDQPDAETSDNIQHSQQTNIHAPGETRTYNLRNRAAANPHLRPPVRRTISNTSDLAVLPFECTRFTCHCKTTEYTGIPVSKL